MEERKIRVKGHLGTWHRDIIYAYGNILIKFRLDFEFKFFLSEKRFKDQYKYEVSRKLHLIKPKIDHRLSSMLCDFPNVGCRVLFTQKVKSVKSIKYQNNNRWDLEGISGPTSFT